MRYRLLSLLAAILYVIEYRYVYIHYVLEKYAYAGLTSKPAESIVLLVLLAAIPILLFDGLKTLGSAFSIFIYIFVYVPFLVTVFVADFPVIIRISQCVCFLLCMILIFISDKKYAGCNFFLSIKRPFSFPNFEFFVWSLFLISIVLCRDNLSFVNFLSEGNDLYELRLSQGLEGLGGIFTYITLWLSHALIPLLFVSYYKDRKRLKFFASFIAMIFMFMLDKQKITFVIPFAMTGMLLLVDRYKSVFEKGFHIIIIGILFISSLSTFFYAQKNEDDFAAQSLAILTIIRTQCIAGEQLDRYTHFFEIQDNPYTYYSHISVIRNITGAYPYKESIGQEVAGDGSNSNASFFLMDGIAAAGIWGCFIITFVFIICKMFLNSLEKKMDISSLIVIFFFAIFSMLNTSLFTSLFSFGIMTIYISLLLFRFPALEKKSINHS